jgi:hypothetical protein
MAPGLAGAGIAAGGRPELGVAGIAPGREDGIVAPGRGELGIAEPGLAGALPGGRGGLLNVFESLMLRP